MDRFATEKHLKQNKEIIRINQVQANRIAALETETTKLLSENIQLRTQVIQLTHRQDLSAQKALLDRKLREIHRIVKGLGSTALLPASPASVVVPPIIRHSPKKTNLLDISPENSPDRSTIDFVSTRKHKSLYAGPSRIAATPSSSPKIADSLGAQVEVARDSIMRDVQDVVCEESTISSSSASAAAAASQERRKDRDRDRERDARRSSRRLSRSSTELVPLQQDETFSAGSPHTDRKSEASSTTTDRSTRRKSRSSMNFEPAPLYAPTESTSYHYKDNKENISEHCKSTTASIRLLHSSPVKNRSALDVIADPLPSVNNNNNNNIMQQPQPLCSTKTPLNELVEEMVKSEPTSPSLDQNHHQESGRSRRGATKTVNYAEPSLRVKMRRTESLPGDKRRKSTYRRTSSGTDPDPRISLPSSSSSSSSSSAVRHNTILLTEEEEP